MGNSCTGISLSSAGSAHAHTSTSADSHHSAAPASGTTFTATTTSTNTCSSMASTLTELSSSGFPLVSSTPLRSGSKSLHCFTYNDLKSATGGFRPESFLGEGGFGAVYKGWIDENGYAPTKPGMGMMIAVKKLKSESMQGHREWLAEVHFLGQLHHPNLVRLIGFCAEDDHRLLAYEYLSCGSLENHLFLRRGAPISWTIRVQIALGAARGLAFLHEATVIYRDFKASNILLDSDYNAKLSDFGLAKEGPKGNNTHVSTGVKGTYGYAAPEYVATGHLTTKSDIYSYGVVLLELLTGRRTIDRNLPPGEKNLVDWAPPLIQDKKKMYRLMDPRLSAQYSSKGAHTIASLALNCLCLDAKSRPNMTQIIETLESLSISKETIALDAKNQN